MVAMKRKILNNLFNITILSLLSYSCSTTRILPEDSYRLKSNKIEIEQKGSIKPSELEPYLRQKSNTYYFFGWNPFLYIYNWGNNKGGEWDNIVKRIGQAPVEFDKSAVSNTVLNFKNRLHSLGFYFATVKDSIIYKRRVAEVIYRVNPGKRYSIDEISYHIDDPEINRIILSDTLSSDIKKGSWLAETDLVKEAERITTLLKDNGYYNFSNNFISFSADTIKKPGSLLLNVFVRNYTRNEDPKEARKHYKYYINNITVRPDYDPSDVNASAQTSDTVVTRKGIFVIFKDKLKIRKSFIDKLNNLEPGNMYSQKSVTSTYDRFNEVNIFSGTNIRFDDAGFKADSSAALVDCMIRLTPSKRQGYTLNLELSSNSNNLFGVSPAISYFHKNLFNGGEWLNLNFMGNFQMNFNNMVRSTELGVSATLSIPDFLFISNKRFKRSLPRTDLRLLYNYQDRPEFTRILVSSAFGYNWRTSRKTQFNLIPLQLNIVKLSNISTSFYQSLENPFIRNSYRNYFDLGAGFNLNYISDPDLNYWNSVIKIKWNNDLAGNVLSIFNNLLEKDSTGAHTIGKTPYSQYIKTDFTIVWTKRVGRSSSAAFRFNAGIGYAYGNSKSLPFEKLFYAGGANSLRGWQARSVGPGYSQIDTTFSIPNQTGDIKLEANAELRFPLVNKFEGALFADMGNVWTIKRKNTAESGNFSFGTFYKSIALNWGTGVRYNLGFVILRLDLGMVTYNPALKKWVAPADWFRKDTYSVQFGVGYPF